jgi:hypothetical protein
MEKEFYYQSLKVTEMGDLEQNIEKYLREIEILKRKKEGVDSKVKKLQLEQQNIDNQIDSLQEYINKLKIKEVKVSNHAVLRYFERILNYDLNEIRQKILTKEIQENYLLLGDGQYQNGEIILVIKNDTVITIMENGGKK